MKSPKPASQIVRDVVIKISVNESERALIRRNCTALGTTVSAAGRHLLLNHGAPQQQHRICIRGLREGPWLDPVARRLMLGRRGGAPAPRMRL